MKKLIPAILVTTSLLIGGVIPVSAATTKPKVTVPKQESIYKAYKSAYDKTLNEQRLSLQANYPFLDLVYVKQNQYDADLQNGLLKVTQPYKKETYGKTILVSQYQGKDSYDFDFTTNKYRVLTNWDTDLNNKINTKHFEIARNILKPYETFLKTAKGEVKTVNGLKEIKVIVPGNVAAKVYKDVQLSTSYSEGKEYMDVYLNRPNLDPLAKSMMEQQYPKTISMYENFLQNWSATDATLVFTINKNGYIQSVSEKFNIYIANLKFKTTLLNKVTFVSFGDKVDIKPLGAEDITQ